ncbi:MAG TPA: hypothetical protein VEL76_30000, partial [Gemmataceae bacterium]|nr:hypothetical protein [Gemmataceae bacterium]
AKECGRKGDVIDLWAAVQGLSLRAAALELVQTFGLEPAPRRNREEERLRTVNEGSNARPSRGPSGVRPAMRRRTVLTARHHGDGA